MEGPEGRAEEGRTAANGFAERQAWASGLEGLVQGGGVARPGGLPARCGA